MQYQYIHVHVINMLFYHMLSFIRECDSTL